MSSAISPEMAESIYQLGQQIPSLSNRSIARQLGVSRDSVDKYRSGPAPDASAPAEVESASMHVADARSIERYRTDNNRLRAMNRMLAGRGALPVESVIDQFKEWMENEAPTRFEYKPKVYPAPKTTGSVFDKDHEEIVALVLSDWHCGETIRFDETNGLNQFNSLVMSNRGWAIIDKFKRIVRGHQAMYSVRKIWLALLGDFCHGSVHPENVLTNDLLDVPSAMLVARLLTLAIEELKTLGIPIEADCVVGNHPRINLKKMPTKRQAQTSFDWVVYKMLEQKYEDDPQVTIRIHPGQFGIVDLFGHRVAVEHGYGSSGQFDMVAKLRAMYDNPIYRESTGLAGSSIDYIVIGDKHRSQSGEGYLVNGALPGSNELGVAWRLSPIGAIQTMFGVSRRRIPTWIYPLDVRNITSEAAENTFSQYATQFMQQNGR